MQVSNAYPNPVSYSQGVVMVKLLTACSTSAKMEVYTLAYRSVYSQSFMVNGPKTVGWGLTDNGGSHVATGLYHLRFTANGSYVEDNVIVNP
jgi:hypothetical protein